MRRPTIDWSPSEIDCRLPWKRRPLSRVRNARCLGRAGGWAGGGSERRQTWEAEVAIEVLMLFMRGRADVSAFYPTFVSLMTPRRDYSGRATVT